MIYFDTRIEHDYDMINELIEKEMHRTKALALKNLSSVVHFETEEFAQILAYSWFDSLGAADKIADKLHLSKLDFLAIGEDFEGFKEEYLKNCDEAQNF